MRFTGIALACLLASPLLAWADDWKKLEGSWVPMAMELGGQKFDAAMLKDTKLTLTKEKYELESPNVKDKGDIKADDSKKPKEMDIVSKEGPNKDKTILAIYSFEGDILKVCYGLDGKTRPGEFKTSKDDGFFMAVYKRERK